VMGLNSNPITLISDVIRYGVFFTASKYLLKNIYNFKKIFSLQKKI